VSQVWPNGGVTARPLTCLVCMSLTTSAPSEAGAPPTHDDHLATGLPSIQELEARLAAANERLAAATAQRDAYREALVRIRLAMHSIPGV
jgi:hypothetical protein